MDKSKEKKYVCKFCNKECPSGKSLGGHIRIHTNGFKVNSDSYNAKKNKRLVDQREQLCCRECGKGFVSLKALSAHMDCHSEREKKIVIDNQYDTEASSSPTWKRAKKLMKQSNSESFTNGSSSCGSEIDQEDKDGAWSLMIMSRESSSFKKGVVNSLAESSDNNSVIVETKSSSGEEIKMFTVLETDKVAVDGQLRSVVVDDDDNGVTTCDSDGSDSDYFMNGPKKSESDISVDGSLRNTGFNRFRNSDEVGVKEGGVKYDLMSKSKSKSKRVFPSHGSGVHTLETDSCADTNSKIHRFSDSKSSMAKKASGTKNKSNVHECPFCFRVFKSGQALGGHKRTHSIGNQEHKVAETRNLINLNMPALDIDE